jgi:hypothetical protein
MAINVNTGDGNNIAWDNTDFWQSGSSVGEMSKKWTNDFKDATQLKKPASNYIAVIHENGIIKAWREFTAKDSTKSLFELLSSTASIASYSKSGATCKSQITESVISESGISKILKEDGITRGTGDNLYANCNSGHITLNGISHGADLNRISAKTSATEYSYDAGWGLGKKYDAEGNPKYGTCNAMLFSCGACDSFMMMHPEAYGDNHSCLASVQEKLGDKLGGCASDTYTEAQHKTYGAANFTKGSTHGYGRQCQRRRRRQRLCSKRNSKQQQI